MSLTSGGYELTSPCRYKWTNKSSALVTSRHFLQYIFYYISFFKPFSFLSLWVSTIFCELHFEIPNIEDFSSLNNQRRKYTFDYKVTLPESGCILQLHLVPQWLSRLFCLVIIQIIYSRFWFGVQVIWMLDVYIRPWWLKCKYLMSLWLGDCQFRGLR